MKILALRHPREDSDPEWRKRAPELRDQVKALLDEDIPAANPAGTNRHSSVRATHASAPDTSSRAVARLKRDDPETAERVVKGEITANAAAREKGWRKPRVLLANPETVARKIRESFTEDQIAQLIALLLPSGNDP